MFKWLLASVGLPPWTMYAIVAGLAALVVTGAYIKGRMDSSANCREASLQRTIDAMKRDVAMQQAADLAEEMLLKKLEAENKSLETELQEYVDALDNSGNCSLDDNDVTRLRRLGSI